MAATPDTAAPERGGADGTRDAGPAALDDRDRRALTECMTVLPDGGDLYTVVGENGNGEYTVDVRDGVCTCADYTYRDPAQGCKHLRRARYATGRQPLPPAVERDDVAVDGQLGEHVDGEVRRLAADGGEIVTAGDDGEIIDGDSDTESDAEGDGRPSDCQCVAFHSDIDLPCWPCYREGFRSVNPAVENDGGEGGR